MECLYYLLSPIEYTICLQGTQVLGSMTGLGTQSFVFQACTVVLAQVGMGDKYILRQNFLVEHKTDGVELGAVEGSS